MKPSRNLWLASTTAVWLAVVSTPLAQTVTLSSLLAEMSDPAAVARWPQPTYRCLQASSYNRASTNRNQPNQDTSGWFADSDGLGYLRTETNGGRREWVIMEHQGPGCLTKLWTPFFYFGFNDRKGPNLRVYLDGQTTPVLNESLIELVTGRGTFKPPFAELTARAGNSYLPIPFARSCKVTLAGKPFYHLINYRAYAPGTQVETFTRATYEAASAELERTGRALTAPPDPNQGALRKAAQLKPGEPLEIPLPAGPGAVRQFTVRLPGATAHPAWLRSTVLAMSFDGEESVWCPLGDFFCSADALHPIRTWSRTVTADGTMTCRWVMPYERSGALRLLNLGAQLVEVTLQVEATPWTWDDRSLHFHANWRPDDVVPGKPFRDWNYIAIRGQGIYVGDAWTVLNIQGSWWGEGDEKIYIDEAWDKGFPTHFGTGTEDYYGWAGGEVPTRRDEFSGPFLANARVGGLDGRTTGFNICTRTRSLDAIPFAHRLVFDMESSFGTDIRQPWNLLGYSAVTFWYARPGATHNRPAQPEATARPIMSLVDLKAKAEALRPRANQARPLAVGGYEFELLKPTAFSPGLQAGPQRPAEDFQPAQWSGERHFFIPAKRAGDFVEFTFIEQFAAKDLLLTLTTSYDFGIGTISVNGRVAAERLDFFSTTPTVKTIELGRHTPVDNRFVIRCELVAANPRSRGAKTYMGLDCIVFKPLPEAGRSEVTPGPDAGSVARVFTEARENPLRPGQELPAGLPPRPGAPTTFTGSAKPGEFFVFQIGVAAHQDLGPLAMAFGEVTNGLERIPAAAWRCLSLGGTNHRGEPFVKEITVRKGQFQVLWVGVAVPSTARGVFTGTAQVRLTPAQTVPVGLTLKVEGSPVADHGDAVARNLSRLRWLDSTVGSEPTLTHPFTAVRTEARVIQVLGRELALGEDGLPARVTSHFSPANTRIETVGREVLAQPAAFVVETSAGRVRWQNAFGRLQHTDLEATWTARGTTEGLRTETSGRLDYTGSGEIRVRLIAERDLELKDARVELPFREEAARYFMGLHQPGGRRPAEVHWKWDVKKRQDCFWLGDVNAGLMVRFKDADYLRPPANIYYSFRPLRLPKSWGNEGRGGVDLAPAPDQQVLARAYSGPRSLQKGDILDFVFELYVTPFRTLDTEKQWAVRFTHLGGPDRRRIDEAVAQADPQHGPNVVNIHHASFYSPYINYPYSDDSFPAFRELVQRAHARGVKLRVYYTTREITQNMPELFPLHSFNGEIILPGPGPEARTLLHPKGPHAWLKENLRQDFVPAWEARVGAPYADLDLSVITTPDSRWSNFYLEGLQWLVDKADFDGMYIDDTALDATSLRRARRILDRRPGRLIDLHTWNHFNGWAGFANNLTIYMEILPYLDRLWLGEGFDASAVTPEFWLVEMSGLPFGLMSEMLDGANPWRGLVFGETARHAYSGDPRGLWKVWDDFGIQGTEFLPFWLKDCPVTTGQSSVLATVYRKKDRAFVALGSWAKENTQVQLSLDWKALGLDPARATLYAPAIAGMQPEKIWNPGESIPVAPKRGWFLVLDEVPRQLGGAAPPAVVPGQR